jgi:hypothetical protein
MAIWPVPLVQQVLLCTKMEFRDVVKNKYGLRAAVDGVLTSSNAMVGVLAGRNAVVGVLTGRNAVVGVLTNRN